MNRKQSSIMRTGRHVYLLLGAMCALAAGCASTPTMQAPPTLLPVVADLTGVTAEGRLEPVRYVTLAPGVEALVSAVLVSEGERVAAGQVIARLDDTDAQSLEVAQTKAALELGNAYEAFRKAQSELDAYPLPRVFSGLTAEQAARTWLAELDSASAAFAPYKGTSRKTLKPRNAFQNWVYPSLPRRVLFDTGEYDEMALVYKKRVDVARMNYTKAVQWLLLDSAFTTATARLADAQRRYDGLKDTSTTDVVEATRSALATAEIRAPFSGTITKLDLKVGEVVAAGEAVATLADFSSWIVKTTDLTEIDVVGISEGEPVTISLDAITGAAFNGVVLFVDLGYSDRQGDIVYPVRILLAESDPGMRWGMTAQVTFDK
jgi:multidrug efflux pump subunit AcrA (membrane-fusion protein)